jgi:hypothetical protein
MVTVSPSKSVDDQPSKSPWNRIAASSRYWIVGSSPPS